MTEPPAGWTSPTSVPGMAEPPAWGTPPGGGWYGGPPAAPKPGVVPLRPLALGELLDGAISVIRRYPRPTLGISAVIAVIVTAINIVFVLSLSSQDFSSGFSDGFSDGSSSGSSSTDGFSAGLTNGLASGPGAIVSYLAGLVLTGALVAVVGKAVLGQPAPLGEVWATVRPRIWALLGLSLLTGLCIAAGPVIGVGAAVALGAGIGAGTLVLGIPLALAGLALGAYLFVRLSLAPAVLVLEKAGVTTAMRRSGVLAKGSWWRLFGILLLAWIIASIVAGILTVPLGLVAAVVSGGSSGGTAFLVASQVGAGLASVLISPFSAGVRALLYVDRRMRAEGLDVALQASLPA